MSLLHAHQLSHRYRTGGLLRKRGWLQVLDSIDLQLQAGESVGLLGGSGSGKSTLARLLLGLETPSQGQVSFAGQAVSQLRGEQARAFQRTVQLVFQDAPGAFNPQRSIAWSIAEPLRHLSDLDETARHRRTVELLEQMGLDAEHAERLPQQLSGGQLQRANIARALAISPKLVVLDEALSNLDRVLQLQLLQLLDALRRDQGTAFVLITHDLTLVRYFCQRVVVLDAGSIVEDRTVSGDLSFEHPTGRQLQAAVLPERPTKTCARVSTSLA
ncbi:nickel import ATP-binding protein NikE [Pseudomonas sp. SWI6]|uniref:nickel import ATP-binding protein NikE n=1 Tax=unclassified Pseudomonas TaxID=196821 RepID=UPI000CE5D7EE|nr:MULTISPECIES: nickel import ATP-binding protein NikE [unclassified Pseudomonas]AVD82833.1 nickel import ATP-binding protein NikE [Pseudomonas sp. SWI6]WEZ86800.1 nickel import ATP-binding protein NikE [Pseudomonas sp. NyZ480]